MVAAVVRVIVLLLVPAHTVAPLIVAAAGWTAAFGLVLWRFVAWLPSSRLDEKEG
jgi:uncharacterized protein involved in response to NO